MADSLPPSVRPGCGHVAACPQLTLLWSPLAPRTSHLAPYLPLPTYLPTCYLPTYLPTYLAPSHCSAVLCCALLCSAFAFALPSRSLFCLRRCFAFAFAVRCFAFVVALPSLLCLCFTRSLLCRRCFAFAIAFVAVPLLSLLCLRLRCFVAVALPSLLCLCLLVCLGVSGRRPCACFAASQLRSFALALLCFVVFCGALRCSALAHALRRCFDPCFALLCLAVHCVRVRVLVCIVCGSLLWRWLGLAWR